MTTTAVEPHSLFCLNITKLAPAPTPVHPHLDRASKLYIKAAQGDTNAILKTLSPDFCYYAVRAPDGSPLAAASSNCGLYMQQTKAIYNNL